MREKGFSPPWMISHLWQVEGGAEWWEKNGTTFKGVFDLTPGSYSMTFVERYVKKKAESLGMSVEDYLSGKDYLDEYQHKQSSLEKDWADYLILAAQKEKPSSDSNEGHEQIKTDEFDAEFSQNYWKKLKK